MKTTIVAPMLLVTALGLAGCSGADTQADTKTVTTTTTVAPVTTTTAPTEETTTTDASPSPSDVTDTATSGTETATSTADASATDLRDFDVNAASEQELATRLEQAGVPDAATWAKRVKENGPYTSENAAAKIRELAQKYPVDLTTINEVRKALGY